MSLSAAQIFVRTDDVESVVEQAVRGLSEWARGVGDLGEVVSAPERRLIVLPAVEGFTTIIEASGRVDRLLARDLLARFGADVIRFELDGHFLSADLEVLTSDGEEEWSAPPLPDDPEEMPAYVDVEAESFARLVAHGVPSGLVAIDWEDLVDPVSPVGEGWRLQVTAGIGRVACDPFPVGELAAGFLEGPRARPDLWVEGADGRAEVIEARRLTGEWHPAAADSLVAVEEAQLRRILPTLAWTAEGPLVPRVRFSYEGVDDADFDLALERARTRRPVIALLTSGELPTISGLVEALHKLTRRSPFAVGQVCGRRLEIRHVAHPGWHFFADLHALWRESMSESPGEAMLAQLEGLLEGVHRPVDFDPLRLWPMLLPERRVEPGVMRRSLVSGVSVALGLDLGDVLLPVTPKMLREAGLGFDDALAHAVARLEVATEENDEFVIYEQPEGATISAEFPDISSAARILSEAVLSHLAQQLGDECFVAIPSRDVLLAAEGTPEARRWLEREVVARFREAEHPLSTMLWSVQNGQLVAEGPALSEAV